MSSRRSRSFTHHHHHYHHHYYHYPNPHTNSQLFQHNQAQQLSQRSDLHSNGEYNKEFSEREVDTIPEDDLGVGRRVPYKSEGTRFKRSKIQDIETEFGLLPGRYRATGQGFWVVFLHGVRWYPGELEGLAVIAFGSVARRAPSFITSQGVSLGSSTLHFEVSTGPLFSFTSRNRPASDVGLTGCPLDDESLNTQVCIRDHQDELMVVPNGRLMIWVIGGRDDVPWRYFNLLRQRAERIINSPDVPEAFSSIGTVGGAEVPETIKQIVMEIGDVVPTTPSDEERTSYESDENTCYLTPLTSSRCASPMNLDP